MIFLEHASITQSNIKDKFGAPEYSYHFVRNGFKPVLDRLGTRVDVADPQRDVDDAWRAAKARGEDCLFISYNPPQKTPMGLECPTLPLFAWEYDTIPVELWNEDKRHDWRYVLSRTGMAATLSEASAQAVRDTMGQDFPVWAMPTPLFDAFARGKSAPRAWREPFDMTLDGALAVDAGAINLEAFGMDRPRSEGIHQLRVLDRAAAEQKRVAQTLRLQGVIYTAVLCPADGRKNWRDMVSGFVWAFRDNPDATLLFKLTHATVEDGLFPVLQHLSTVGAFKCRIVLINGLLSNEAYSALIDATTYAVNTSLAEGQCLPLTEYMSAGRPSVAPSHSAMRDYVAPDNSFVVKSEVRPAAWPQDERLAMRAHHELISFTDLVHKFRDSFRMARDNPKGYERMSAAAVESMRRVCSYDVVEARFSELLKRIGMSGRPA